MQMISLEELVAVMLEELKPSSLDEYNKIKHHQVRELYLEDVDNDSSRQLVRSIIDFNREDANIPVESRKPIYIYINSYGGSVTDAYAIIDAITMSKTPVYTVCIGVAYSAGGIILMSGHKRKMYPKSSFMFHEGSAGMFGDAGKVKDTVKFYEKQLKQLKELVLTRSKITEELYSEKVDRDWYLTADECLQHGIIDEISSTLY